MPGIPDASPRGRIRVWYGLPNISMAMLWTPLNVMQGIYIKHYGFSMGAMAAILMASRAYDAFADVAVGSMSDWLKARTGGRKAVVAVGGLLYALTALFVYQPPQRVGWVYVTFWLFAFFSGYATLMISHLAWGGEVARDSHEKTALFSAYKAAGYIGLCLFYAVPLLPMFGSSDITPATIRVAVLSAVAIFVPALILCLWLVPEGRKTVSQPWRHQSSLKSAGARSLLKSRPFLILMAAYALCGTGLGIWYGMIFLFVDIYLRRGALYAPLYLLAFAIGSLAALGWSGIARWTGKKAAWSLGTGLLLATVLGTAALTPQNATPWSVGLLLVLNTIGFASFELLPGSILADVADFSELKTGKNRSGLHFAAYMFSTKAIFALGGAIGLALAAWLGFNPNAPIQSARGSWAIHMVMSAVPAVLLLAGLALIQFIPMDERRHAIVRRRLEIRDLRRARQSV